MLNPWGTGLGVSHPANCPEAVRAGQGRLGVPPRRGAPAHPPASQALAQRAVCTWTALSSASNKKLPFPEGISPATSHFSWRSRLSQGSKCRRRQPGFSVSPLIAQINFSGLEGVHIFPNQLLHHRNSQGGWEDGLSFCRGYYVER